VFGRKKYSANVRAMIVMLLGVLPPKLEDVLVGGIGGASGSEKFKKNY